MTFLAEKKEATTNCSDGSAGRGHEVQISTLEGFSFWFIFWTKDTPKLFDIRWDWSGGVFPVRKWDILLIPTCAGFLPSTVCNLHWRHPRPSKTWLKTHRLWCPWVTENPSHSLGMLFPQEVHPVPGVCFTPWSAQKKITFRNIVNFLSCAHNFPTFRNASKSYYFGGVKNWLVNRVGNEHSWSYQHSSWIV